jgi:SAM-dependent methyltransferase
MAALKIDIGCGYAKRDGYVGIDKEAIACVDHVVDVEREPLPFADGSVDTIFTAHCLEHLADQALVFREISRVAVNGARLEIWTPYGWTNEAFIYTHRTFFNELHYLHPCCMFPEHWRPILGATWQLTEFQFIVAPDVLDDLAAHGMGLDFALKYLKGIVVEFGVHIRIWHESPPPAVAPPLRTYAAARDGERIPVPVDGTGRGSRFMRRLRAFTRRSRRP